MRHYENTVQDSAGNALSGITVNVYLAGTTTAATIYSDDGTTPKTNPLTSSSLGRFDFYAADGLYDLKFSGAGITTYTMEDVEVTDAIGAADDDDTVWTVQLFNQVRYAHAFEGATAGAKIAAAITDLPAGGGIIDCRGFAGAQSLPATLTVSKPCILIGPGAAATFSLAAAVDGNIINITSSTVTIQDFVLDGVRASQSAGNGIAFNGVNDIRILNNTIQNVYARGIEFYNADRVRIKGNTLTNCTQAGNNAAIYMIGDAASDTLVIDDNYIDQSSSNGGGIKITTGGVGTSTGIVLRDIRITNNRVIVGDDASADTLGIEVFTSNGGTVRDIVVANNTVLGENSTNTRIYGISLGVESAESGGGGHNISVTGNVVRDARKIGFELFGHNVTATGNTFDSCGELLIMGSSKAGGELHHSINFSDNSVVNPLDTSYVIRVDGQTHGLSEVSICNNIVRSPSVATTGIHITGSFINSRIQGNQLVLSSGSSNGIVAVATSTLTDVLIQNNMIDLTSTTGGSGIQFNQNAGVTKNKVRIAENMIIQPFTHGIFFNSANTSTMDDIHLVNNAIADAGTDGIRLTGGAGAILLRAVVTGNQVYSCAGIGINSNSGTLTDFAYHGNTLVDNGTAESIGTPDYISNSTSAFSKAVFDDNVTLLGTGSTLGLTYVPATPRLNITNTNQTSTAQQVVALRHMPATPAAGQGPSLGFYAQNSTPAEFRYARIDGVATTNTASSEVGTLNFYATNGATEQKMLVLDGGVVGATIINPGNAASVVLRLTYEATNDDPTEDIILYRQTTTNATLTTMATIAITSDRTYYLEARVWARRTGGVAGTADDGAAYVVRGAYTTKTGTVTALGSSPVAEFTAEDQAGWDCTFNISGSNVLLQVTGAADNSVTWHGCLRRYFVGS